MATILRMPEVLANATEAAISTWLVEEGAAFTARQPLAEVETEKAMVEVTVEEAGVLGRQLAKPGVTIAVGAPIAVLISSGEGEAEINALLGDQPAAVQPSSVAEPPAAGPTAAAEVTEGTSTAPGTRLFASPLARRLAKERGIDLRGVTGTGPGGRLVRRDIEAAATVAQTPVPAAAATAVPASGYRAIPHTPMRKAIARRLTESKSTVPHFYLTTDCRVDELLSLRKQVNEFLSVKVSVNDLVIKAVALAFQDVPEANVTWSDTELRRYDNVDISVAVATERGLVTPVVRGVDRLGLVELSAKVAELVGRARTGRLHQDEIEGGSFAVTNLGMYGTSEFSAILNPPQSGILAVGAAAPQAVVVDGALAVATIMRCTLSVDHRAVDGALAARWLAAFTARIEHPVALVL